jgi:hypothetical protein
VLSDFPGDRGPKDEDLKALKTSMRFTFHKPCLLLSLFIGLNTPHCLAQITRGPYLQSGTTSNLLVRWRTSEPMSSQVRFGLQPQSLPWQVSDATPVVDHTLVLTNLAPNTRYFYAVDDGQTSLAGGPEYFFWTAPLQAKPTRIWVLGDAGTSFNQPDYTGLGLIKEGQRAVRDAYYAHAGSRYTDIWLLLGDNAYNDGRDGDYQTNFFEIYPTMTRQAVIWPALGNHDVDVLGTGDDRAYLNIFFTANPRRSWRCAFRQ